MARISSYPRDLDVVDNDSWIGTSVPGLQTRNFTAAAVAKYLNVKGKISVSAQMVFKFTGNGTPTGGEFSGPANNTPINGVTTMSISDTDASGQNTAAFMDYLVGNDILISKQNNISDFGHFTIDSYTTKGNFHTLNVTNIGANSNLEINKFYDFAVFTLSSQGTPTFEYSQVAPATVWNIQHNLVKFPSITVIDNAGTVVSGQYTYIDNNNVTLTFSAGFAGKAYLN